MSPNEPKEMTVDAVFQLISNALYEALSDGRTIKTSTFIGALHMLLLDQEGIMREYFNQLRKEEAEKEKQGREES